jgi:hypothetical protein
MRWLLFVKKAMAALPVKLVKRTLRKKLGVEGYQKFIGQYPESVRWETTKRLIFAGAGSA